MLAVDIGNTRIKFAEWEDNAWINYSSHQYDMTSLPGLFDKIFQKIVAQPVYISCVADAIKSPVSAWFKSKWDMRPTFCYSVHKLAGVTNAYVNPETLGIDRWLAMIAAFNACRSSVCVIDCGTAVTLDVVSSDGLHQGGLIMPGLRVMQESLVSRASKIHTSSGKMVALAKNTGDAVQSGCVQMLAAGLDGLLKKQMNIDPGLQFVMTGGDARQITEHMQIKIQYMEMLVLDGLRIVVSLDC